MINTPSGNPVHLFYHNIISVTSSIHLKLPHRKINLYLGVKEYFSSEYSCFLSTPQCDYKPWEPLCFSLTLWTFVWPLSSKAMRGLIRSMGQCHESIDLRTWRWISILTSSTASQIYTLIKTTDLPVNYQKEIVSVVQYEKNIERNFWPQSLRGQTWICHVDFFHGFPTRAQTHITKNRKVNSVIAKLAQMHRIRHHNNYQCLSDAKYPADGDP